MSAITAITGGGSAALTRGVGVIDFYQATCAPCRMLEPHLERVAAAFSGVPTYRVDIDRDLDIARRFGVKSLPTVLLIEDGAEVARLDGLIREEQLRAMFEEANARRGEEAE